MELFPSLQISWISGWIPIALFFLTLMAMLRIFPREVVDWLYDRSGWTRQQTRLGGLGLPFAIAGLILILFTPLKINRLIFWIGLVGYLLGFAGFISALTSFRRTPLEQPVTSGLYQLSRNPQWVAFALTVLSISLMVGSWTIFMLFSVRIILNHFRVLGEEQTCLVKYGQEYQQYLNKVPRYFLFF